VPKAPSRFATLVATIFRILVLTVLFAALGMGVGLFCGILGTVVLGAIKDTQPDMAVAYRSIALPVAALFAAVAFVYNVVNTIRRAVRHA